MFAHHRRVAWLVRFVVPIVLLLVVVPWVGAQRTPAPASLSPPPDSAPSFALYRTTGFLPTDGYVAMDPHTLADLPGSAPPRIGNGVGWTMVSSDGWTAASDDNGEVAIWDLRTGRERSRFSVSGTASPFALSRDGARLVFDVRETNSAVAPPPHAWTVFDTATGRAVLTIPEEPTGVQGLLVDEVAWRMYRFYDSGAQSTSVRVVATDLTTGEDLSQVTVADLQVGSWPTDQPEGDQSVLANFVPGLALAPDGRQLAIVHPAQEAVTLIATHPLRVERTIAFGPRPSRWQRLAALLPLWPQNAEAKGGDGTWRRAVFAADGRHLYVFGDRYTMDGMQVVRHGLGLAVVDLATGAATEPILTDERIYSVLPAPGGQSVYVSSYLQNGHSPVTTFNVRRLEATTLRLLAERALDFESCCLLIPTVPNT